MNYLRLSADWETVRLADSYGEQVDISSIGITQNLVLELEAWSSRYQTIIPMTAAERLDAAKIISALDHEGLDLCERIASETGSKVEYFSEGLLRRLTRLPNGRVQ